MGRSRVSDVPRRASADLSAVESYHALLRDDPGLAEVTSQRLLEEHERHGLYVRERPLCHVLRPRFLSANDGETLQSTSGRMAELFEQAGHQVLGRDDLLDDLGASDLERELWRVDPGYPGFAVTSRLDSFLGPDGPQFVEYNAESPASIGFCDVLSDTFRDLPAMRRWHRSEEARPFTARRALLDAMLDAYRAWGGRGTPVVAVIDWESVITRRDFELCADFFRDNGLQTVIVDPRAFTYDRRGLTVDGMHVDLIYRRVLLHELLERATEAQPLLRAYADGAVCMVNSPRSKLLHKKALMAMLSDPDSGLEITPEQRELVARTIPWTRRMVEGVTSYGNNSVDLVPFAIDKQEQLALKPSDEYGGKGVILGWETSEDDWKRALEGVGRQHYVLQEKIPVPHEQFPTWNEGGLAFVDLMVDADPLLFRGRTGGILTRVSGSALLNVSAGSGSTTPTFVVDEEM